MEEIKIMEALLFEVVGAEEEIMTVVGVRCEAVEGMTTVCVCGRGWRCSSK